jgi:hypothetical protein
LRIAADPAQAAELLVGPDATAETRARWLAAVSRRDSLGGAGAGAARPGTAIVGSPDTVLRMIDAYRFGETVLPRLPVDRAAPQAKSFTWNTLFDLDRGAGTDAPARVAGGERP